MDILNYAIPWWIWSLAGPALAIALFLVIARLFGIRYGVWAAAAVVGLLQFYAALQRARQQGYEDRDRIGRKNDDEAIAKGIAARNDARADGVRDDGFRRD